MSKKRYGRSRGFSHITPGDIAGDYRLFGYIDGLKRALKILSTSDRTAAYKEIKLLIRNFGEENIHIL